MALPVTPSPASPDGPIKGSTRRISAQEAREAVALARPDLAPTDPRFQTAVLLLMADQIGPNVERLARLTGFSPGFVAQRARRLADHGIWVTGVNWQSLLADRELGPDFWRDVDVAEGVAWRQTLGPGQYRWGTVGAWEPEVAPESEPSAPEAEPPSPADADEPADGPPIDPATGEVDWDAIGRSIITDWDERRDHYLPRLMEGYGKG